MKLQCPNGAVTNLPRGKNINYPFCHNKRTLNKITSKKKKNVNKMKQGVIQLNKIKLNYLNQI